MTSSAAFVIWGYLLSVSTVVVDVTTSPVYLPEWRIVSSAYAGSIPGWPSPASQVPVTIHLIGCEEVKSAKLRCSIGIENNRKVNAEIPISVNATRFYKKERISFRELLIELGCVRDVNDDSTFEKDPKIEMFTLFGNRSVPGTIRVLAPGERLILRFSTDVRSGHQKVNELRARIGGNDVILSPNQDGYDEVKTNIPALFATSGPIDSAAGK